MEVPTTLMMKTRRRRRRHHPVAVAAAVAAGQLALPQLWGLALPPVLELLL